MNKPQPIKRSKSLAPLSREHHQGLLLVWKIRRDAGKSIAPREVAGFIADEFASTLEPHFREEEDLLFSKLEASDPLRLKAEQQHSAIRELVAGIRSAPPQDYLMCSMFADLLEEHIRFEERELFNYMEATFTEAQLEEIGSMLEEQNKKGSCNPRNNESPDNNAGTK